MPGGRIDIEVYPDTKDFPGRLQSGLKSSTGLASTIGKGLGAAIAAGTAVAAVGLKSVIELGVEYQSNLNELQAVTGATGLQMIQVGRIATQLGADMTLPATSAADAASAMKELAKGGLSVDQAMTAAKGTLQLAAAAQIDAAAAAEIQSDALNQFGLSAENAGHVADILANTANAASGEITDMANALKYVGPVARSLGVDIDSTATAIGVLAVNGIRGEQAGTSLRGMLASLAAPSKPAAEALKTLGVNAFDASGKFVGLRAITEQLSAAKGKLTDAAFAEAAAVAFGNEGLTIANALANSGVSAFDSMATAVTKAGGAADVAAAKTKGLGGAWEGFKSQLETVAIGLFEVIDGPLEGLVRSAANAVSELGPAITSGLESAVAAGSLFGPRLAEALRSRGQVVAAAVRDVLQPLAQGSVSLLNAALNIGIGLWDDFTDVLRNAVAAAKPVAVGVKAIAQAATDGDGPVSALAAGVGLLGDGARIAGSLLLPLGSLVGTLASAFAALPGPIQTAVVAMGLLAAFRSPLTNLGQTVTDKVTTPFRQLGETIRLQQALLTGSTDIASAQVGKLGLAFAALEARVPVIGRMADSFRTASTAAQGFVTGQVALVQAASGISGQYTGVANALGKTEGALRGVAGAAAGTVSALGTGLKAAATGLVGALGGPFGVALAAASVGLSLLASSQQRAAQEAQQHSSYVDGLTAALIESNGVVNESVRVTQAKALQSQKVADSERTVADAARDAGISLNDLTDATLGNGDALDALRTKLQGVVEANTTYSTSAAAAKSGRVNDIVSMNDQGTAAKGLLDSINGLAKGYDESKKKQEELDRAIKEGRASVLDATDSGRTLAGAMKVLSNNMSSADDKARALYDALNALSGGHISLEKATFQVAENLDRLKDLFGENVDRTQGWGTSLNNAGAALINADGSINGATKNGRALRDTLDDLVRSTADVAAKTFTMARAQGDSVPQATAKAVAAAQQSRDSFIAMAASLGISAEQAQVLADKAGLIPAQVAIAVSTPGSDTTRQELAIVKGLVDAVPPGKEIHMQTISTEAEQKLTELGFHVQHMPDGSVTITGNTGPAYSALNAFLNAPATKVVTVVYSGGQSLGIGIRAVNHDGNIVSAFAAGGFANGGMATGFRAGVPQIFPPRNLRITGDRMVDDEAYIPINRETRSISLLAETARRMGFDIARRFATGGFANSGNSSTALPAPVSMDGMRITGSLDLGNGLVGVIDGRIASAFGSAGTAITRRRR